MRCLTWIYGGMLLLALSSYAQGQSKLERLQEEIGLAIDPVSKALACYRVAEHFDIVLQSNEVMEYLDSARYFIQEDVRFVESNMPSDPEVYKSIDEVVRNLIGEIYILEGRALKANGDLNKAFEALERAKVFALENDSTHVSYLFHLCDFYYAIGDFHNCFIAAYRGMELAERVDDLYHLSWIYTRIGAVHEVNGDHDKTFEYYEKALEMVQVSADSSLHLVLLSNIGIALANVMNNDSAIVVVQELIKVSNAYQNERELALAYGLLGEIFVSKENYPEALRNFQQSLSYAEKTGENFRLSSIYAAYGSVLLDVGREEEGLEMVRQGMTLAVEIQNKLTQRTASEILYEYYSKQGNYRKAYQYLSQYSAMNDSILHSENENQVSNLRISYELDKKTREAELLQTENELKNARLETNSSQIRQQSILLIAILVISLILLVAAIVLFNYLKRRTREKQELVALNSTITQQQQEIQQRHDQLSTTLTELRSTQDKLIHSEKMASLGVLIAGIGHEINNPLNFINQSVLALNMKLKRGTLNPIEDEIKEFDGITEGIQRIAGIINSLRRFSRDSKKMTEACNLADILDGCLEIVNSKIKQKELNISKNYPRDAPTIQGNEGKLHQAFLNFISNAIDASDTKGEITVSIEAKDGHWQVQVMDTGAGMDAETLKHLGDPFFTTKDPGQGTGLGIYISKDIIEAHKGEVNYESEVGQGTTLSVILPGN